MRGGWAAQECCVSNKFLGEADSACPGTALGEPMLWTNPASVLLFCMKLTLMDSQESFQEPQVNPQKMSPWVRLSLLQDQVQVQGQWVSSLTGRWNQLEAL